MQQNHKQQTSQDELLEQLRDFILNCPGRDEKSNAIRTEALNIYCRSLLERADELSAQKVLDILSEAENTSGIQFDFFKAKALQQIGKLEQAVHYMVSAIVYDSGSLAPQVTQLLSEVVDKIEQFETQAEDFNKMLNDCIELAKFGNKSLNNRQTALLLAEFLVFAADNEQSRLTEAESLLNTLAEETDSGDVNFLRCRARLLAEQGEFEAAAGLWAKLCEMRKDELALTNQQSWKWWRAKYYELYCWSKLPQTRKADVTHSIEILENSFHNVPPLWAKRLSLLKSGAVAR
jgi:tetratricopeptide (TPR) repeat protein